MDYFDLYSRFLLVYANKHYLKWKKNTCLFAQLENRDNPYNFGYSQPYWMGEMRSALAKDDEEAVKAIFANESQYDPMMIECRKEASEYQHGGLNV